MKKLSLLLISFAFGNLSHAAEQASSARAQTQYDQFIDQMTETLIQDAAKKTPFIYACDLFDLLEEHHKTPCASCGKTGKLKKCSRCKSIFYCNEDCQQKDWKSHKGKCPKLASDKHIKILNFFRFY